MKERKRKLTSLTLAMSLGLMTTLASCEVNPDGGGEGGEGGEGAEQGSVIKQSKYILSSSHKGSKTGQGGEGDETGQGGEGGETGQGGEGGETGQGGEGGETGQGGEGGEGTPSRQHGNS